MKYYFYSPDILKKKHAIVLFLVNTRNELKSDFIFIFSNQKAECWVCFDPFYFSFVVVGYCRKIEREQLRYDPIEFAFNFCVYR